MDKQARINLRNTATDLRSKHRGHTIGSYIWAGITGIAVGRLFMHAYQAGQCKSLQLLSEDVLSVTDID